MRELKIARRDFLALGITGIAGLMTVGLTRKGAAAPLLRPPGAQDETTFISSCLRCQECVSSCLTGCLEPAGKEYGTTKLWTPRFDPSYAKCEFTLCDRACAKSCPVGAIDRPPDHEVRIGTAAVDHTKCIAWAQGKSCLVCYERCSFQAIDFDSRGRPQVLPSNCVGCGACQNTCVTNPDPSIVVYPAGSVPGQNGGGKQGRNS